MDKCPRCDSKKTEFLCESPVKGCWTMYSCPVCTFTWRSTEPENITNPELYNQRFKVDPSDMGKYQIHPAIPERRK
ncbi:non-oxidative hydroxyarylic acid decarboxylases subunit D [Fictibacillus enclensis]|uniref:non-oxidative hydroxyarylic acid decarboxylases subunit D n=1 Tax=Fictibacillus enclensis TaxID=1017270 RepID=UPI0025A094FE|nr:non-oxidative hydroxyarylic acid decarboxylases subunit D [Fictibacillus enclensis]MDM5197046.1 non-oxidative hydroxyarylic acid decarboxylases subunit D [Fictibacillus enclensis]